jgi:hypothetical protein
MPCYEVRIISVELKIASKAILLDAIKGLGLSHRLSSDGKMIYLTGVEINLETGIANLEGGYQDVFNQIKQAYSREAVKTVAKKFAWATKTQGSNITVNKVRW